MNASNGMTVFGGQDVSVLKRLLESRQLVWSSIGAEFAEGMERKDWKALWREIKEFRGSLNWFVGDWVNFGERKWGSKYAMAIEITDWEYQHLRNCSYVCANVHLSSREDKLDWTHHAVVAPLEREEQRKWLKLALEKDWSVSELRIAVRKAQATRKPSSARCLGFVPATWLASGMRWFRSQRVEHWDPNRRAALASQLRPLVELYHRLLPNA